MIMGMVSELERYSDCIPHYAAVKKFLEDNDLGSLEKGKHPVDSDNAYVLIQEYETKNDQDLPWEAHRNYIDLQIMLQGEECIGYAPIEQLAVMEPYNGEKDAVLFAKEGVGSRLFLKNSMFCIFFPEDGHKPGCFRKSPKNVRKAVLKIRCR